MLKIIDGKKIASLIKDEIKDEIILLEKKYKKVPGLAVILVGNDPASEVYVRNKINACEKTGIKSFCYKLDKDISEKELLKLIDELNLNDDVNGILVQLPVPKHISEEKILYTILPEKDVDGFHPINVGKLWTDSKSGFVSCTPAGIIELILRNNIAVEGKNVVIIGRSNIVGKPLAGLFLQRKLNATVTVCHSKTENINEFTKKADILISAIGKPLTIKADMIKEGAVIIDVGINRVPCDKSKNKQRLCGDVDFDDVCKKASWITPVPGGVGPMTITMLLKNTLLSFKRKHGENEQ